MATQFSADAIEFLADVVLLNRTVYGGPDALRENFLDDFDATRDPDKAGNREALFVYDRYDQYLNEYGFRTMSSADLGFRPRQISASESTDGLDHNYTYAGDLFRNNYRDDGQAETEFTQAGAVALAALKDNGDGQTLYLTFRGTDVDGPSADGEAGTAIGQMRYYEQLHDLIEQVYAFVGDPDNDVTQLVVSGHSLGGTVADLFALYDGARFNAIDGLDLSVISLASAGVDPGALELRTDYDEDVVKVGSGGAVTFRTPDWYFQYDHAEDIVRNPDQYDASRHAAEDPLQFPITSAAVSTLEDHLHFEDNRLTFETPLIDQYEVSKDLETTFLVNHYADFYELIGTEFSKTWPLVSDMAFDKFVALFGKSDAVRGTPGSNNVNGWDMSADGAVDYSAEGADYFMLGLSGQDRIRAGSGNDFLSGGAGQDRLFAGRGEDRLLGDIDGKSGDDLLKGGGGDDIMMADRGDDLLFGGKGGDIFEILRSNGRDTIADFSGATGDGDVLDLTAIGGIDSWAALVEQMTETADGLVIDLGNANVVVLNGVLGSDISEADVLL